MRWRFGTVGFCSEALPWPLAVGLKRARAETIESHNEGVRPLDTRRTLHIDGVLDTPPVMTKLDFRAIADGS